MVSQDLNGNVREIGQRERAALRALHDRRARQLLPAYDYIVCGAGSAACAIAGRLAEDPSLTILVIEAGEWDDSPPVLDPRLWFTNLGTERDWGDVASPGPGVNHRAVPEHTARVVGGGSSINASIWVRPFRSDLDHWAEATGVKDWGYEHAISIFKRIENWQGDPDERYRGKGGPVWCQTAHNPHPIAPSMLDAARELGLPVLKSLNGEREELGAGFALMEHIIRDGQRQNMATSYLYPVLSQDNITVLTGAEVTKLIIAGDAVLGVELVRSNRVISVNASTEVILAAGAINTPRVLLLSGVGDHESLKALGISTIVHAPEVGRNFQDHILHGGCLWESPSQLEYRNSAAEASGYFRTESGLEFPDVSVVQVELPYVSDVIGKAYDPPSSSWALCAGLVNPKSRGEVRLKSSSPLDRPVIDARFLSDPDDVRSLSKSIEIARELGNSNSMREHIVREVVPGARLKGDELTNFIRNGATTYFHASGTCRMGKDSTAVVDPELRINGLRNVRIADSSIMPKIPSCPTMAACVLIGERLVEILRKSH